MYTLFVPFHITLAIFRYKSVIDYWEYEVEVEKMFIATLD